MKTIRVNLQNRSYDIHIGIDILKDINAFIGSYSAHNLMIISNPKVYELVGKGIERLLVKEGNKVYVSLIPDGERFKSLRYASKLYDELIKEGIQRDSLILAVGGGVIGDLAGFVASTYMRGIPYVQIPTTLLAQVDSSVGGKVAVNHPKGKNLVGAFYQPKKVIIDCQVLRTLPSNEVINGLAEVVKISAIKDKGFFKFLEKNIDKIMASDLDVTANAIFRSCYHKASIVEKDEREKGIRAILNYGHTFAHALESQGKYRQMKHGEAVLIGMKLASALSLTLRLCTKETTSRQKGLIDRLGVSLKGTRPAPDELIKAMDRDKKIKGGKIRFVLTKDIGSAIIREGVPRGALLWVLKKELSLN